MSPSSWIVWQNGSTLERASIRTIMAGDSQSAYAYLDTRPALGFITRKNATQLKCHTRMQSILRPCRRQSLSES